MKHVDNFKQVAWRAFPATDLQAQAVITQREVIRFRERLAAPILMDVPEGAFLPTAWTQPYSLNQ